MLPWLSAGNMACSLKVYTPLLTCSQLHKHAIYCTVIITATVPVKKSFHELDVFAVHYWLDDIRCNGTEESLLDCEHAAPGLHDCGYNERARVACKSSLHLMPFALVVQCCSEYAGNGTSRIDTMPERGSTVLAVPHHDHGHRITGVFY